MSKESLFEQKKSLRKTDIVLLISAVLSLIVCAIIGIVMHVKTGTLLDQNAYKHWSTEGKTAQVTCFFSRGADINDFTIGSMESVLTKELSAYIDPDEDDDGKNDRPLFVDSYSADGLVSITSELGKVTDIPAVGIGNDFFTFHPVKLVSGQYFSGADLMQDSVILDDLTAWLLFGSCDIAGMTVTIGDVPHYVKGVYERDTDSISEAAGLTGSMVFISYDSLKTYGKTNGINCYEVIALNPVKNYLYSTIHDKINMKKEDLVMVDNSERFSLAATFGIIGDLFVRSMQNTAVAYPYWENIARTYETMRGFFLLIQIVLILYPLTLLVIYVIVLIRRHKASGKSFRKDFVAAVRGIPLYFKEHKKRGKADPEKLLKIRHQKTAEESKNIEVHETSEESKTTEVHETSEESKDSKEAKDSEEQDVAETPEKSDVSEEKISEKSEVLEEKTEEKEDE